MPSTRHVLLQLTCDELATAVERFELAVKDRRAKEGLLDAIVSSKKVMLAEVLAGLSRDRLKELCRSFDLDDGGREKNALVERLAGTKAVEAAPTSKRSNGPATNVTLW